MARLSLREQDRLIRRDWPEFKTVMLGNGFGLWVGRVYGLSAAYEVSVLYVTDHFQDGFEWAHSDFPEVRVLSPKIARRPEDPGQPVPHVYDETGRKILCLFDPAENGWTDDRAITATTIPWIADWLRFYEAWQATGTWHGGGRDHLRPRRLAAAATELGVRKIRRAEQLCGCSASRPTVASRIVEPLLPSARWQLLDLVEFANVRAAPARTLLPETIERLAA